QFLHGVEGAKPGSKFASQNRYAPVRYRQDNLGIDRELVEFERGKPVRLMRAAQADCARFCATWFRNIRQQQGIDARWTPRASAKGSIAAYDAVLLVDVPARHAAARRAVREVRGITIAAGERAVGSLAGELLERG